MSKVREVEIVTTGTSVTLTTTTENVAVSSGPVKTPFQTHRVIIIGWAQVTTGAGTTALTPRIRRGTAITGTLVGEANAEENKVVAAETEPVFIMVVEERAGEESVEYSLTVQQADATGNGTIVQSGILVLVL